MRVQDCIHALPASQILMLVGLAVAMTVSLIRPLYPELTLLQHAPTVTVLLGAPLLLWRYPLSDRAVACIIGFFILHCLGAHYSYSFVPYDQWTQRLTGASISETFGFTRNHYDRLVHFAFGMLAIPPAREVAVRHLGFSRRLAAYVAIGFVIESSFTYEVFEWLLAVFMSPETADAYNGQQGDMFDAQKDMALAALGAATMSGWLALHSWARATRREGHV